MTYICFVIPCTRWFTTIPVTSSFTNSSFSIGNWTSSDWIIGRSIRLCSTTAIIIVVIIIVVVAVVVIVGVAIFVVIIIGIVVIVIII